MKIRDYSIRADTMTRKKGDINRKDLDLIYNAVEDYISENHKLCSISEIEELVEFNKAKCNSLLKILVKNKELYKIFEGKGNPTVYIPSYMMDGILRIQNNPRWVENYSFNEKKDKIEKIEQLREGIKQYDMFERLLHATNTPLEEAVAFTFEFLKFDNLKHLKDPEYHDIEFTHDDKLYLVEVKGKGKNGNKDDILQLGGWIKQKIDEGMKIDEIEGLFVINHYRKIDPSTRGDNLTIKAKEFLKLYNCKFIETFCLYKLVKKVLNNEITKEDAREIVITGQSVN